MLNLISKRISTFLLSHCLINESNKNVFTYCFELLLSLVLNITTCILLILFTRQYVTGIIFLIVFKAIRQCIGGYHAKTHFRCWLTFVVIFGIFLYSISRIDAIYFFPIYLLTIMIVVPINLTIGPVINENKTMTIDEKNKLRKKLKNITIFWCILASALFSNNYTEKLSLSILLALLTTTLSALI